MDKYFKEQIRQATIEAMPDFVPKKIKEDVSKIMIKIMESVEGESTAGTVIALRILADVYESCLLENANNQIGISASSISELAKILKPSGTVH